MGIRVYNLGNDGWNAVEQPLREAGLNDMQVHSEMWKVNKKFLDNQIAEGKEFQFTTNPKEIDTKSFGYQEYSYLISKEYTLEKINGIWSMYK